MDLIFKELAAGFPDGEHLARVLVRLVIAALLGGLIGFEREREGKEAGLRTQMLVAIGAALFTLIPLEFTRIHGQQLPLQFDLGRVIQGIAAGIGFLGAGSILKLEGELKIHGLTTAASIWVTAAVGVAIGAGALWPAILAVMVTWIILFGLHRVEPILKR